jgi:SAM-dependent methyltransferase
MSTIGEVFSDTSSPDRHYGPFESKRQRHGRQPSPLHDTRIALGHSPVSARYRDNVIIALWSAWRNSSGAVIANVRMKSCGVATMARWVTRTREAARRQFFMKLRDIRLFLKSSRTDAAIERLRSRLGSNEAVFDALYRETRDPWGSIAPEFRYQRHKYDTLLALLPDRCFASALDLGCGLGPLTRLLAPRADHVLGLDVAETAIVEARRLTREYPNVKLSRGDVVELPGSLNNSFDLVVIADVLYYISPLPNSLLEAIAGRIANLLTDGGICLLVNHFFHATQKESRLTRRIHDAFCASPRLTVIAEHRRPFYLANLFCRSSGGEPRVPHDE